jgi:uncharacterized protein with FMN-binding domain
VRKYVIGALVAIVFIAYTVLLRGQRSGQVIAPPLLTQPHSSSSSPSSSSAPAVSYKDGTYTGDVENAFYGNVQVAAVISGGKITAVNFLEYPNDNPNSQYINQQATKYLQQEAIQAQSAQVSTVTGATFTSQAFVQSLTSALSQAKLG